jgi:hypothetical protein
MDNMNPIKENQGGWGGRRVFMRESVHQRVQEKTS